MIGCPGIVNAARAGHVTLANAIGNGVADDKLLYTYVLDLIRYYLHEEPVISNVETHRLDSEDVVAHVLDHLHELVLKPVDRAGGKGIVIGPHADERTLTSLRAAVSADPRGWIAQVTVFDLQRPHQQLRVTATSLVETSEQPARNGSLDWADLRIPSTMDERAEVLTPAPLSTIDAELADRAAELVAASAASPYADVTPLKGVYHGAPSTGLGVTVEITRLA